MQRIAATVISLGALLAIGLSGCSGEPPPKLVKAAGKVLHEGKPVTAGSILFHPDGANSIRTEAPTSLLQVDGSFSMKTFPYGEGVTAGRYKVTLALELANRLGRPGYAKPDQTPWEIDVPETGIADRVFEVK